MASVTDAIADLGIEIIRIPGGCTGLCQPLDVGINKPFKAQVRALWEECMIEEIDRTGMVYAPSRRGHFELGGTGCLGDGPQAPHAKCMEEDGIRLVC